MDPNEHKRVGYITSLQISTSLAADLSVSVPTPTKPKYKGIKITPPHAAKVVGVMEKFEWDGGAKDTIRLDFYVSQANAANLEDFELQTSSGLKSKRQPCLLDHRL